jgi:2-polyprenyl-6-methoxyphenol hydroxylase-like FAD-dependent oxidoreductase
MRALLPASADFIVARAIDLRTGPAFQEVVLTGGETLRARLIILASGIADVLRHRLDIPRHTHSEGQCITFGFDVVPGLNAVFPTTPLTYYGDGVADGIDYLSLFPVNGGSGTDRLRANLFVFLDPKDAWLRDFRRAPKDVLTRTLPGLTRVLGDFEVSGAVQHWVTNLYVAQKVERDGVVFIGDAYQTSCPAAGTGVSRLLVDVERLCNHHVPAWLRTPGMGAEKIAAFYADPMKQRADRHAGELAAYRRALTIDRAPKWALQRAKVRMRRQLMGMIDAVRPEWAAALQARRRPGFSLEGKATR